MSQHDENLDNQSPVLFRTDLNNALQALLTNSSGPSSPASPVAYQFWVDTTNNLLKVRNAANSAWVTIGSPSLSFLGFLQSSGGILAGALLAAVGTIGAPGIAFSGDTNSGIYRVSANTWGLVSDGVEYIRISSSGITFLGTGALQLPSGTTAQRPGSPVNRMFRYNSETEAYEAYVGSSWKKIPATSTYPFAESDFVSNKVVGNGIINPSFGMLENTNTMQADLSNTSMVDVTNLSVAPSVNAYVAQWSPNGEYLAVGLDNTSPRVHIYKRTGKEFVKVADPATVPTGIVGGASFTGDLLSLAYLSTPYIATYQRAKGTDTFTKLADPATLPAGNGNCCAWNPQGTILAVGHGITPFITLYERSGTTLTKLSNPASLPPTQVFSLTWSPDGRFLAAGTTVGGSFPYVTIYEVTNGTTFTKLADPSNINNVSASQIAFSPNGRYLLIGGSVGMSLYERNNTTFTLVSSPSVVSTPRSVAWAPNGKVAAAFLTNGSVTLYSVSGSTFTSIINFTPVGSTSCYRGSFSPDGQFLAIVYTGSPYLKIYQVNVDMNDSGLLVVEKKFRLGT